MLTNQLVRVPQVVRCEIILSEIPVAIPTLMCVRWCHKQRSRVLLYRAGLQFLLK